MGAQGPSDALDVASASVSERLTIQNVRPNPFAQSTTITLALPLRAPAHLAVYDLAGRVVRTLVDGVLEAGIHPITWDGRTDAGGAVAGGVYLAKLVSGGETSVRRVVLIK